MIDLSNLEDFIATYNEDFKKINVQQSPIKLSPGKYTGEIVKVELDQTATGSIVLRWTLKVLSPLSVGSLTEKTDWLKDLKNLEYMKASFAKLGILVPDLKQLPKIAASLTGMQIGFTVVQNGNYVNVYVNEKIADAPFSSPASFAATASVVINGKIQQEDDIPF